MVTHCSHAVFFSLIPTHQKQSKVYRVHPWGFFPQHFYAFDTGPYAFEILIASILKTSQRAKINVTTHFGRLNANVRTKTAEDGTPSIQAVWKIQIR